MSASLEFGEVEPLLPAVGELPVPRWENPESHAEALRWWRSCRQCRMVGRSIFEVLLHQRWCRGGCDPEWPTEDADGSR
ncbi:hypothetical protein [Amycolatopsis magusensis]|uniref:hypothetical protein n=1 Tax=Amycolatopsis magusensis TaxID=882444 RepID=UPI0037A5A940